VNAEFFVLAFTAAFNPKLIAVDLLLIENSRPRAMFLSIIAGGMTVGVAIGLVDVLVVRADMVNSQKSVSAGVDLAIGLILLVLCGLLMTGLLPPKHRTAASAPAGANPKKESKGENWAQRTLREPRLLLACAIGAVIGLPGASYLAALHNLIAGKHSTVIQVVAVLVFVVIEFLLILIPWLFLELWPAATTAFLRRSQAWLAGHVRQLAAWICGLLGVYLVISASVRLA
jgi:ABC-type Fe3+-siderophore transport system permease subunit